MIWIKVLLGAFSIIALILVITQIVFPILWPKYFNRWWLFNISSKKLTPSEKFKEAELLLNEVKTMYADADKEIGDEIVSFETELKEKKTISKETRQRLEKLKNVK